MIIKIIAERAARPPMTETEILLVEFNSFNIFTDETMIVAINKISIVYPRYLALWVISAPVAVADIPRKDDFTDIHGKKKQIAPSAAATIIKIFLIETDLVPWTGGLY